MGFSVEDGNADGLFWVNSTFLSSSNRATTATTF